MRRLYFFKSGGGFIELPEPSNIDDYHTVEVDDDFIWQGEIVDPLTGKLIMPAADKDLLFYSIRQQRDALMASFSWRIERYNREVRLGLENTDNLQVLDTYMQQLADITVQPGFPYSVTWPPQP